MIRNFGQFIEALVSMQDQINKGGHSTPDFQEFFKPAFPQVNIFTEETQLVVTAELPGVKKEDLTLEVKGDQLRLAGKRLAPYKDSTIHKQEKGYSQFERLVKLPFAVEQEGVQAKLEDGILTVTLPRTKADQAQKIVIQ